MEVDSEFELGEQVRDRISGFEGVVAAISHHLTGCTRIGVDPIGEENTTRRPDSEFFFEEQLETMDDVFTVSDEPVRCVDFELGTTVRDTVTNVEGVVSTVTFSLMNCPRVAIQPVEDDLTDVSDRQWVDVPRIEVVGEGVSATFEPLQASEDEAATGPAGEDLVRVTNRQ